jgi:hypothetical protein
VEVIFDRFGDLNRLFRIAICVFIGGVLLTPIDIYFGFAFFTAKAAPWWLDAIEGLNASAFFLGGLAVLVLGLAKLMAKSED